MAGPVQLKKEDMEALLRTRMVCAYVNLPHQEMMLWYDTVRDSLRTGRGAGFTLAKINEIAKQNFEKPGKGVGQKDALAIIALIKESELWIDFKFKDSDERKTRHRIEGTLEARMALGNALYTGGIEAFKKKCKELGYLDQFEAIQDRLKLRPDLAKSSGIIDRNILAVTTITRTQKEEEDKIEKSGRKKSHDA